MIFFVFFGVFFNNFFNDFEISLEFYDFDNPIKFIPRKIFGLFNGR
jgi:hypothetical protein